MLNIDLMRVKPLLGPLERDEANELQKALKAACVKNPTYWNFNSRAMYLIGENNYVWMDDCCSHPDFITFEDLFVENGEDYQFESELMALLGG